APRAEAPAGDSPVCTGSRVGVCLPAARCSPLWPRRSSRGARQACLPLIPRRPRLSDSRVAWSGGRYIQRRQGLAQLFAEKQSRPVQASLHDGPVEPGAEGRLAPEGVDLPDHGPERVLDDFLCILLVSRDARGQAIRALTVRGDETLRRRRLVQSKRLEEVEIPVCARSTI